MICHDVRENLSAFLDSELPDDLQDKVARHLKQCPECLAEKERIVMVTGTVRTLEIPPLKSDVFQNVMASINQQDIGKSYHVFSGMLSSFSILAMVLVALLSLSPLGQAVLAFWSATIHNLLDMGSLIFKFSSRSPIETGGWTISLTLFFGFILSFYLLRKVLNTYLGGSLNE